jgi:thiol-disulfide isomerase/thioredoxin
MRKYANLFVAGTAMAVLALYGCSKSGSGGGGTTGGTTNKLTVTLSKPSIAADGYDETAIVVKDANNNDVTSSSTITVGGTLSTTGIKFYTSTPGTYRIKASAAGLTSPEVTVTATDPGPSPYTQRVLAEDYTGTWCGFCPRIAYKLDQIANNNSGKLITIAVHNADPMQYTFEAQMRSRYGVTGFPTAVIGRDFKWSENNNEITPLFSRRAPIGIGIESAISGNTISGKIKVGFDVNTGAALRVVIALVEDGLVYPQRNYMNADNTSPWFGAGDPIPGFVHNSTLRLASTDIFGDGVPTAVQTKGSIWEKTFSFTTPGTYNLNKCKIVAFVVFEDGGLRRGLLNVQSVEAGRNKNLD